MFLVSFPICSSRFSNVFLIAFSHVISAPVYNSIFALYGVFVLWWYQYILDCFVASEVHVEAILTAYAFDALTEGFTYGNTMYPKYVLLFWLLLFLLFMELSGLFCWTFLHSILSVYGPWWVFAVSVTTLICWFSVLSSSGVDETILALHFKVLMTLYLDTMWWCLSQYSYWSVWVVSWIHLTWVFHCALEWPTCPRKA